MKWISFALIMSLFFGFQQKPVLEVFLGGISSHHAHENTEPSVLEMIEILITGNLVHTHSHEDHQDDSHSHSHQHSFSSNLSGTIFILTQVHFSFESLKQGWEVKVKIPVIKPYFSEILRPPIYA